MNKLIKLAAAGTASLCISVLAGCASGNIKPGDRDTTGIYDGAWIGTVGAPRSKRAQLPGNWIMTCDWQPFDILLTVKDGHVNLGNLKEKTPVSTKGDFHIEIIGGQSSMRGGVMPGNARNKSVFSGSLAADDLEGKYVQYLSTSGGSGCNSTMKLRRRS